MAIPSALGVWHTVQCLPPRNPSTPAPEALRQAARTVGAYAAIAESMYAQRVADRNENTLPMELEIIDFFEKAADDLREAHALLRG